ncbi:MAG: hypothetical protein QMD86_02700 [Patescibacteria group bacterium]|nr:hypothetical protein [Patescibacteria group bacterium]
MPVYNSVFYGIVFFLIGILLASVGIKLSVVFISILLIEAVIIFLKKSDGVFAIKFI